MPVTCPKPPEYHKTAMPTVPVVPIVHTEPTEPTKPTMPHSSPLTLPIYELANIVYDLQSQP